MKHISTTDLEIFVSAVDEQSLSKAADRNGLVISAVSKRISEVERHLGVKLLNRHGRGVEPTPAGDLLHRQAKALLRSVNELETSIRLFSSDGLPTVRLASNRTTILQFLPQHLSGYLVARPEISIDLLEHRSIDIPRLVSGGAADIGIYHGQHAATGVISYPYCSDRVGLVVPNGHALAEKANIGLEEALDYPFIGSFPMDSIELFMQLAGRTLSRPPTVRMQVTNLEARCMMVGYGLGVALVPESIAERYLVCFNLKLLKLSDHWAERQFWICIADARTARQPIPDLVSHLRQRAASAKGSPGATESDFGSGQAA